MSVTARYRNGIILSYSLLAYSPWEGYRAAVTGDRGRIEVEAIEAVGRTFVAGQEETLPETDNQLHDFGGKHIWVFPMHGAPYNVEVPEGVGGHGGGDRVMLEQIFHPRSPGRSLCPRRHPHRWRSLHSDGHRRQPTPSPPVSPSPSMTC